MRGKTWIAAALLTAGWTLAMALAPVHAKTLRWAAQNDLLTFDPHAQNHQTTLNFQMHVYEALTRYTKDYALEYCSSSRNWSIPKKIVRFSPPSSTFRLPAA